MITLNDHDYAAMTAEPKSARAIAETMLDMIDRAGYTIAGDDDRFVVTTAHVAITIGDGSRHAFERLAAAIEARIAFERAAAMVVASGDNGIPLWLVSGSSVLVRWLAWARIKRPVGKVFALTDQVGIAPVAGRFARRSRRELGQMSVKIRVSAGQAVAERIELSHRVSAIAVLGDKATIRIRRQHLPETIVTALQDDPRRNDRWRAAEIVDHPFFAANDLMVANVLNDGEDVVVELETAWEPLVPIPKSAWKAVPRGANPAFPWRPTNREVADLYRLAARGERLLRGDG